MKKLSKILVFLFLFLFFVISDNNFNFDVRRIIITEANQKLFALNTNERINRRSLKNIAIFIKFSDSDLNVINHLDDEQSVLNAEKIFNSDVLFDMDTINGIIKVPSFKKYYEKQSYGNLSITTEIFPKKNGKVVSYQDSHPIGYYLKYSDTNKIGYKDKTESLKRETELLNSAVSYVSNMVSLYGLTANDLDTDNDGKIDAISFIIEGQNNLSSTIGWGDLLWSHENSNTGISSTILGKNVSSYTLLYADDYTQSAGLFSLNRGTYGTMIHEFGHVLGYMDLYRHGDSASKPVGFYDIMGNSIGSNPQNFLTYYISEYNSVTNWHGSIPVINKTTNNVIVYKPKFVDRNEKRAVKLQFDGNNDEYFIVEYHEKMNTYESYSADSSGIIIYRVNEKNKYSGNTDGSDYGKKDHVYVFRPGETGLGEGKGNLSSATLNMQRKVFGKDLNLNNKDFDNQSIFFSDGTNSGIKIEVISETSDSITFNVTFPKMEGLGTKESPYLIRDVNTFLYLMSLSTKNKYYKLTSDLDFNNIDYPSINFEGNLDGNNHTIRNIKTDGSGVFNNVGNYQQRTTITNLFFENLVVYSKLGNYLGGFASVSENVTFSNIHLKSGSVTYEGTSINDLVSVGGFIGNVNNTTILENCSSNLKVTAKKNVGGFIGINMNAKIKNSFSTGIVSGTEKVGGFIGIQAILDSSYNVPDNVYYGCNDSSNLALVGGYAKDFHNLGILNEASLSRGITKVSLLKEHSILKGAKIGVSLISTPNATLSYTISSSNLNILGVDGNKIVGLKAGISVISVNINITGCSVKMKLSSNVVVKDQISNVTEKEVLDFLGLTKRGSYIVGFNVGTSVNSIIKRISDCSFATLKSFTNASGISINNGIISTGMKITLYFNNTEYSYTVVVKGDVNGDGKIYATDYVKVRNHIMGKTKLAGAYLMAADINNDGNIYATDYVKIRNYIMGKGEILQG